MALFGTKENGPETAKDAAGKAGKTFIKGGTTALVVLSLLTGIAFSSPAEINEDQMRASQTPIVMDVDDYMNSQLDDDDDEADEEKGAKSGLIARFRQAVLQLPSSVRLLIVTPLWLLGTALMTTVSYLWNIIFASPLGAFIAAFAMGFGVLVLLFAATAKILFPDIPLSKILSKRNVLMLGIAALALAGIDAVAPLFWHKYPAVSALVKIGIGASVVGVLTLRTKALFESIKGNKYKGLPASAV